MRVARDSPAELQQCKLPAAVKAHLRTCGACSCQQDAAGSGTPTATGSSRRLPAQHTICPQHCLAAGLSQALSCQAAGHASAGCSSAPDSLDLQRGYVHQALLAGDTCTLLSSTPLQNCSQRMVHHKGIGCKEHRLAEEGRQAKTPCQLGFSSGSGGSSSEALFAIQAGQQA